MKTQLNMWVYEEDATAIRAKAAREGLHIGEYVTRTVLGRDPAHPQSLEDRVVRLERLLAEDECTCDPAIGKPGSAYRVEREIDYRCPRHGATASEGSIEWQR